MESPIKSAESVSNPVASPEQLVGNVTGSKDMIFAASLFALAFLGIYFYKTMLEIKVAKQELLLNAALMQENEVSQS